MRTALALAILTALGACSRLLEAFTLPTFPGG